MKSRCDQILVRRSDVSTSAFLFFFFFFFFSQEYCCCSAKISSSSEKNKKYCSPSSCGTISISFPFRLPTDPIHCGLPDYELHCVSNTTVLHLRRQVKVMDNHVEEILYKEKKVMDYHVEEILYEEKLIRVIDPVPWRNQLSFLPSYSVETVHGETSFSITTLEPYEVDYKHDDSWVYIIKCGVEIKDPLYKPLPSKEEPYLYARADRRNHRLPVSNLHPSCKLMMRLPLVTSDARRPRSGRYGGVHGQMMWGFYLSWRRPLMCRGCHQQGSICPRQCDYGRHLSAVAVHFYHFCIIVPFVFSFLSQV